MSGAEDDTVAGEMAVATLENQLPQEQTLAALIAGRYQIARWLGGGGMGRVYAAIDIELQEQVALKVLRGGLSEEAIERFRREVRLTRKIRHRNVARMFDIGEHDGSKFLTMELIEGVPLTRLANGKLSWRKTRALVVQIAEGLDAAHQAGIIHRDLKPDNVLVERDTERAVITDFGIARSLDDVHVTQIGSVVGTPRYMAPEQLAGHEVDARSDVFALGVIMYELVTGQRPWLGDSAITIAVAQATQPPRPITNDQIPAWFVELVFRCLAIEPGNRPQRALEVAETLVGEMTSPNTLRDPSASSPGLMTPHATRSMRPSGNTRGPALGGSSSNIPVAAGSQPAMLAVSESTIAVLPVTCAPGDEYLADGLLEDLIDSLSSTAGLRVRPAGLVRGVREPDPREVGRQLEVDHIVAVSLRRMPAAPMGSHTPTATTLHGPPGVPAAPPGVLRLSARLINVVDGFQVWAHRSESSEARIFESSEELVRGIATALSTRASANSRPTDPRAVDLYLRARAEMRRFWGSHMLAAADMLAQAVEIAPNSAPILGAYAYATVQAWVLRGLPDMVDRARMAMDRGLASGHGEAHLASGLFKWNHGDIEGAARELATSIVRAPMSAQAHESAARMLVEVDPGGSARHHFETALGLDPGRALVIATDLARLDALAGDFAAAEARVAPLLHHPDPSIVQLGSIFAARFAGWRGQSKEMLGFTQRFAERMGPQAAGLVDFLVHTSGTTHDDQIRWDKFLALFEGGGRPLRSQLMGLQLFVEVAMSAGRIELASRTLAQAQRMGLADLYWLDHCPLFLPYQTSPYLRVIREQIAERAQRALQAFQAVAG